MEKTAELFQKKDIKLTPQRAYIYQLLSESKRALKAYDIIELMSEPGKNVKPPVVYRILDLFQEKGMIHKLQGINAFTLCTHAMEKAHPCVQAICETCLKVEETCANNQEINIRKPKGFASRYTVLEVYGTCANCLK